MRRQGGLGRNGGRQRWGLLLLLPGLLGFDGSRAREALDLALHHVYGTNLLAGIELTVEENDRSQSQLSFAFGRKHKGDEVRTLMYTGDGRRNSPRALLLQRPGQHDRIFVSDGGQSQVRAVSAGKHAWQLFGTDFSYDDFRVHTAADYQIEVLGEERQQGEPCVVLRLHPLSGSYRMRLVWLSTERPAILRSDYFDERGLFKRYRVDPKDVVQHFQWWVPMRDEMLDLRTGRRTIRHIRNLLIDTEVPDELFTLTRLARGRMPSF